MLEKECDAILTVLKEHSTDGFRLHQAKRDFLQSLGMTHKKFLLAIEILEIDEMVRKAGLFHHINEIGICRLKNGGYSLLLTKQVNDDQFPNGESDSSTISDNTPKLKWLGNAALFGFIIQQLIERGYLARPTGSFKRDAEIYLKLFEINATHGTLSKEISNWEDQNSLSESNRSKFKIPSITELK